MEKSDKAKLLKESLEERYGSELPAVLEKVKGNKFFQTIKKEIELENKTLKEAKFEASDMGALGKVLELVIEGARPYSGREPWRVITTDQPILKVPRDTLPTAAHNASGTYAVAGSDYAFVTINNTFYPGLDVEWTRQAIQDCAWELRADQIKSAGEAMELYLMDRAVTEIEAFTANTLAIADPLTWANFVDMITAVETEDFHPDYIIVHPNEYGDLLKLDQFIDASVIGGSDPITSGRIKTTLGVTVIRSSRVTAGMAYAVDSTKCIVLAVMQDLKVEPIERPSENRYGFIVTMRVGFGVIHEKAACLGSSL